MEVQYIYTKNRSQFGKWCDFSDCDKIEIDIKSDRTLINNYIRLDPVTQGSQCDKIYSSHEVHQYKCLHKFIYLE